MNGKPYMIDSILDGGVVERGKNDVLMSRGQDGRTIPATRGTPIESGGSRMLELSSTITGLVNLGVGLYNTYQISQARNDIQRTAEMTKDGFRKLHESNNELRDTINYRLDGVVRTLDEQSRTLKTILMAQRAQYRELQNAIRKCTRELTIEIHRGRKEDHEEQLQKEIRELKLHLEDVFEVRRRSPGDSVPPEIRDQIVKISKSIQASIALKHLDYLHVGHPARIRKFTIRLFALGAEYETRETSIRPDLIRSHEHGFQQLASDIRNEARALIEGQSLFNIAFANQAILAQYYAMYFGIRARLNSSTTSSGASSSQVSPDCINWIVDYFAQSEPPAAGQKRHRLTTIPLKTIGDFEWYTKWVGADPAKFDVHSKTNVSIREISKWFGASPVQRVPIPRSDELTWLYRALNPEYRNAYFRNIDTAFDWSPGEAQQLCLGGTDKILIPAKLERPKHTKKMKRASSKRRTRRR